MNINNTKFTYEYVYNYFKDHNCTLLSTEYQNNSTLLDYICECGTVSKIRFNDFKRGVRCNTCGYLKRSITQKKLYSEVQAVFAQENCVLLTSEEDYYKYPKSKLKYICSCGNIHMATYSSFATGRRCPKCAIQRKELTNLQRFATKYPLQNNIILAKAMDTMYHNNTTPCSQQQRVIAKYLGGTLNYQVGVCFLDVAFIEDMVYIEFDGGGHDLSVKLGSLTIDQFLTKERKRRYYLKALGWKEIRIISKTDKIPSENVLLDLYDYAQFYFYTGCGTFVKFDIDNLEVITQHQKQTYDYGELSAVNKND